ncbi:MAG TPA: DUF6702 family protein [Gemmatimonadaceae bacterium]|nr:DUF6702 family protein [Gemmatimonadaceae bacterium]
MPLAAVIFALLLSPAIMRSERAEAHPLHTSLAELTYDAKTGAVQVSLRVFVDDFTRASVAFQQKQRAIRTASAGPAPSPLVAYALASFVLADSRGRRVAFTTCGGKRVGDLMWLCFRGQAASGEKLRVLSQVLFDNFKDQINIVQATANGRRSNLLFTPGEQAKPIR